MTALDGRIDYDVIAAWVRSHPEALAAALVGFALVRPRRVWRWGLRLWGAWRLLGTLQHRLTSR